MEHSKNTYLSSPQIRNTQREIPEFDYESGLLVQTLEGYVNVIENSIEENQGSESVEFKLHSPQRADFLDNKEAKIESFGLVRHHFAEEVRQSALQGISPHPKFTQYYCGFLLDDETSQRFTLTVYEGGPNSGKVSLFKQLESEDPDRRGEEITSGNIETQDELIETVKGLSDFVSFMRDQGELELTRAE